MSQAWLGSLGLPNDKEHREIRLRIEGAAIYEKKTNYVVVDGYDPATNTVYEFHGDYWHGNIDRYPKEMKNHANGKTMLQLRQETHDRSVLIQESGYNLVEMWEWDFLRSLGQEDSESGSAEKVFVSCL